MRDAKRLLARPSPGMLLLKQRVKRATRSRRFASLSRITSPVACIAHRLQCLCNSYAGSWWAMYSSSAAMLLTLLRQGRVEILNSWLFQSLYKLPHCYRLSTAIPCWKYRFSSDHRSQATSSAVSTWEGDHLGTPRAVGFLFFLLSPFIVIKSICRL